MLMIYDIQLRAGDSSDPDDAEWVNVGDHRWVLLTSQKSVALDFLANFPFDDADELVFHIGLMNVLQQIERDRGDGPKRTFQVACKSEDADTWLAELLSYWDDKDLDAIDSWLVGPEPGRSSEALVHYVTGRSKAQPDLRLDSVPIDGDSFSRCLSAIEAMSTTEQWYGMRAAKAMLPYCWYPFVDAWMELTSLYLAEDWEALSARLRQLNGDHSTIRLGDDDQYAEMRVDEFKRMLESSTGLEVDDEVIEAMVAEFPEVSLQDPSKGKS